MNRAKAILGQFLAAISPWAVVVGKIALSVAIIFLSLRLFRSSPIVIGGQAIPFPVLVASADDVVKLAGSLWLLSKA